ncbi:transglycosylase SLT domain-containing protein [archaeon]|nr:transglycosylase SLT domain-containing protein [archaeon]
MKMKGAAPTMQTILILIIMLGILVVFIAAVSRTQSLNALINLDEFGVMKLENTFALTNRSLGMMYYIFTVQSVFDVTGTSVRCGADDDPDVMQDHYWYSFDKTLGGKDDFVNLMDFVTGNNIDGNPKKYNDFQPAICYPMNRRGKVNGMDVKGSAIQVLEEKFASLKDSVKWNTEANGIKIDIPSHEVLTGPSEVINGDEYYWSEFAIDKDAGKPMVNKTNKQTLKLSDGSIVEGTENNNTIYTEFPKMMDFGRLLVRGVFLHLSDPTTSYIKYLDASNVNYDMLNTYKKRIKNFINEDLINSAADIALGDSAVRKTLVTENYKKFELRASDADDGVIFGIPNDEDANDIALILSYDMDVTMKEGKGPVTVSCKTPPVEYADLIKTEVDNKNPDSDSWEFGSIQFSKEDVMAFAEGLMLQESKWDEKIVSECGAAGLGQLMPGTAKQYGLVNIFEDAGFSNCLDVNGNVLTERREYAEGLRGAISNTDSEQIKGIDDRLDPEKNIQASVAYIHEIMKNMATYTKDSEELLKLTATAYNTGEGNVYSAINAAGINKNIDKSNVRFDDISEYLREQTQEYVSLVFGGYACYGGMVSGGDSYYYHDEDNNKFIKRPFSMTVKAKDDLVVTQCYGSSIPIQFFSWQKQPTSGGVMPITTGDMMCCGGNLWSCNTEIPGNAHTATVFDKIGNVAGNIDNVGMCSNAVAGFTPPNAKEFWLQCDPDGFRFYVMQCSSYTSAGQEECKPHDGCYWFEAANPASSGCFDCNTASSCGGYTDGDMCAQCGISGQTCYWNTYDAGQSSGSSQVTYRCENFAKS